MIAVVSWPAAKVVMISSRSCRSDMPSPVSASRAASSISSRSPLGAPPSRRCAIRPYIRSSRAVISCWKRRFAGVGQLVGGLNGFCSREKA